MATPVIFDQYTGLEFVLHGSAHYTETEEPVAIIAAVQGGALYLVPVTATSRFQRSGTIGHLADQTMQDPIKSREPGHGPTGFLYQHKKTGGFYRLQGMALHFFKGMPVALYSAAQGGFFYARNWDQFQEQFEEVPEAISAVESVSDIKRRAAAEE